MTEAKQARPVVSRWSRSTRMALVVLLALGAWAGAWAGAAAGSPRVGAIQDEGTPSTTEAECAVPEVAAPPSATRTPDGTPEAASEADAATPPPVATSGATNSPAETEAALAAELEGVARALAVCLSSGRERTVAILATERYLGQLYGGGVPLPREDYLALAADLDPVSTVIRAVRNVRQVDDDRATAEVVSVVGRQGLRSRWTFVLAPRDERRPDRSSWRVDAEESLPFEVPAGASRLAVAMEEYAFGLEETEVEGPVVVLNGRNGGDEDHEMLVLRLEDGATTNRLLREPGPGLPEGVSYIGQVTVPAGEEGELVLLDVEPGDYALVCLFPTPRGTPHLALGMEATFTVE